MAELNTLETQRGGDAVKASSSRLRRLLTEWRQFGIVAALIATVLVFTAIDHDFFSGYNFVNIFLQSSITAILAIGETLVIITAGIDLRLDRRCSDGRGRGADPQRGLRSAGRHLGFAGRGAAAGLLNGVIITVTRITPFVVTLGTMSIFSGLALIVSNGQTVYGLPQSFSDVLAGSVGPVPTPIIIALVVLVITSVIMKSTKLGEYMIAIGGAREVARLAGINVVFYTAAAYVMSSMLAAVAGMVTVARLGAADPILRARSAASCGRRGCDGRRRSDGRRRQHARRRHRRPLDRDATGRTDFPERTGVLSAGGDRSGHHPRAPLQPSPEGPCMMSRLRVESDQQGCRTLSIDRKNGTRLTDLSCRNCSRPRRRFRAMRRCGSFW